MRIIIVGAGEVGTHIAGILCEEHDVVVVEKDKARCQRLRDQYNMQVVEGNGAHPETLENAGLSKASLLVAVTQSDAVNLTASLIAKLGGPKKQKRVVRIEARQLDPKFNPKAEKLIEEVGANLVVDPDRSVAQAIGQLLDFGYPGVAEHASMGGGTVLMLGAQVRANSNLIGKLSEIGERYEPKWPFIIGAIPRDKETLIPRRDTKIKEGDIVRVVCLADRAKEFMNDLALKDVNYKRVLVIGGGRTGEFLSKYLVKKNIRVRLVEKDEDRINELLQTLPKDVRILQGDATDTDFLESISIDRFDAVLALTGDDETNLLSCLFAKSLGILEAITLLHRLALKPMTEQLDIDVAFSPRTSCANEVLRYVLSANAEEDAEENSTEGSTLTYQEVSSGVSQVETFLDMDVEVLEFTVEPGSKVINKTIADVGFKKKFLIGAVIRKTGGKTLASIARGDTTFKEGDNLVVFARHDDIDEVGSYFAPK